MDSQEFHLAYQKEAIEYTIAEIDLFMKRIHDAVSEDKPIQPDLIEALSTAVARLLRRTSVAMVATEYKIMKESRNTSGQ